MYTVSKQYITIFQTKVTSVDVNFATNSSIVGTPTWVKGEIRDSNHPLRDPVKDY